LKKISVRINEAWIGTHAPPITWAKQFPFNPELASAKHLPVSSTTRKPPYNQSASLAR
jgi:hypothetical protein